MEREREFTGTRSFLDNLKRAAARGDLFPGAAGAFLKWWLKKYTAHPVPTMIVTLVIIVTGIVGNVVNYQQTAKDKREVATLSYSDQIAELDQVEASLRRLATFVSGQRQKVEEAENLLKGLEEQKRQELATAESKVNEIETERKRLEPLLAADRQIVDSLFALQRDQDAADAWRQRGWGFVLGVITSLLGSLLYNVLISVPRRKQRAF